MVYIISTKTLAIKIGHQYPSSLPIILLLAIMSVPSAARTRQLIPRQDVLVHARMAQIVVAFLHASPEELVGAQVLALACVTEYETEVELPASFLTVGI